MNGLGGVETGHAASNKQAERAYGRTGERTREGHRLGEESEQADGRTDRRNGGQLESKHASALDRRNRLIYL